MGNSRGRVTVRPNAGAVLAGKVEVMGQAYICDLCGTVAKNEGLDGWLMVTVLAPASPAAPGLEPLTGTYCSPGCVARAMSAPERAPEG